MRRLDYLHGMGVTTIWLMPFQTSPCRDDGYDVADYYNVDPRYGTLGDFIEFTHGAKQRGIRVLIDLVVNHTCDQHPWFKQARSDPNSKYRNWYVLVEEETALRESRNGISGRTEIDLPPMIAKPKPGTSTDSTIFSPTSIPRIRKCRMRY